MKVLNIILDLFRIMIVEESKDGWGFIGIYFLSYTDLVLEQKEDFNATRCLFGLRLSYGKLYTIYNKLGITSISLSIFWRNFHWEL